MDGAPCLSARGLSPRVRGNLANLAQNSIDKGSIPARAGEPRRDLRLAGVRSVYPRACGGTATATTPATWLTGLSPRVRGNRCLNQRVVAAAGSIPARAGEPRRAVAAIVIRRVYPRACGGTMKDRLTIAPCCGLSPRVRGNLPVWAHVCHVTGSIPARAGEPWLIPASNTAWTVYPRACGGTSQCIDEGLAQCGLSPRVRGNPPGNAQARTVARSIPARAGEPTPWP